MLLDRWNREHPEALLKDHRQFRTYFTRGVKALMKSNLGLMEPNTDTKDLGREALSGGRAATVQQTHTNNLKAWKSVILVMPPFAGILQTPHSLAKRHFSLTRRG